MTSDCLLSIVTPVYQGEEHMAECIESVISQQCGRVEHIIVDGESTDKTLEIVRAYAQKYPHIRFVSDKDHGQSHAMNKGIQMAQGAVIGILNADDFYEPGVFNRVINLLSSLSEPILLVGNCYLRNDANEIMHENKPARLRQEDLLIGSWLNPIPLNPTAYFYHKSLHEKIGLYDEEDHYSMDVDFILKAVAVAQVHYVDEFWGNFRYVAGTKTYDDNRRGENKIRIKKLYKRFIENLPMQKRWRVVTMRFLFQNHHCRYGYTRSGYYVRKLKGKLGVLFSSRSKDGRNNHRG